MSKISDYTVSRLTALLPLAERQAALSPELQRLHHAFLDALIEQGRVLTHAEIETMAPGGDATTAIWTLAANDLIVLDGKGDPVGAYPVTLEQTPHSVEIGGHRIFAMCAFDAAAVGPVFEKNIVIRSRCPMTGQEILIEQDGNTIRTVLPSAQVLVGVWWRDPGSVAARNLCPGIVFLADAAAAVKWQAGDPKNREFASLADAMLAGVAFFGPLVARRDAVPAVR